MKIEMYEEDRAPLTLIEIYHQADACRHTVERAPQRSRIFEQFLPLNQYSDILITGCGSSHHLAISASFAWSEILGRPVTPVASSELAHFPEHYLRSDAKPLVIAISRSGGTTEVKLAVEKLKALYKSRSLALISDEGSVGGVCDAEIVLDECRERSVVMTQAFTCMLVAMYLLADSAVDGSRFDNIVLIPELIDRNLEIAERVFRPLAEDRSISRFFFLGSGAFKGLADECALKMTEMALDTAFGHRTLEFRHGPKATLNSTDQVIVFPTSAEQPYLATLLEELNETGARILVVDSKGYQIGDSRTEFAMSKTLEEIFCPALYAHAGQVLAYWRAAARDLNPDAPRHLKRTVLLDT